MSEKKMVRRSIAIALGIICIILVAGMVEIWLYYLVQNIEKDETITNLNNQIFQLNSEIEDQNSTISSLNTQLTILQNQVSNIRILGAENSTIWIETLSTSIPQDIQLTKQITAIYTNNSAIIPPSQNVSSPGYVSVLVSSNNTSTNVKYVYTASNGTIVGLNQWIQVGLYGIAVFPVQPTTFAYVAFTSFSGTSSFTATAIYHY